MDVGAKFGELVASLGGLGSGRRWRVVVLGT